MIAMLVIKGGVSCSGFGKTQISGHYFTNLTHWPPKITALVQFCNILLFQVQQSFQQEREQTIELINIFM